MTTSMKSRIFVLFSLSLFTVLLFSTSKSVLSAENTIYVDILLGGACAGNYSIENRSCSGADGNAYPTVGEGVSALQAGQTLSIRAGTYTVAQMELSFSGSPTVIQGHPGEQVILFKPEIRRGIFRIRQGTNNLEIRDLYLRSRFYEVITGWEHHSGNIWKYPRPYHDEPTELRFDMNWGPGNGSAQSSVADLDTPLEWAWENDYIWIYTEGDPNQMYANPGINIIDDYDAVGISGDSGASATITRVNFSEFAHGGIKGGAKWYVRDCYFENIGTDSHDHHIYTGAQFSQNNGSIYEHNYFGRVTGYALHLYTTPSGHIIRNNIFDCKNSGEGAIVIGGSQNTVYNNTIVNCQRGVFFFRNGSQYNQVSNNLFFQNGADIDIDRGSGGSSPVNNRITYNYLGSANTCNNCSNDTVSVDGSNIINPANPFISGSPQSWLDFRLNGGALAIDTGYNFGANYNMAFDPQSAYWPPATVDQNAMGSGWEMGAFAYSP